MSEAALKFDDDDNSFGTYAEFGIAAKGISNKKLFDVTAKDILPSGGRPKSANTNSVYPLWSVELYNEPLRIDVRVDDGHCFAENIFLNVFGDGDTVSDAMDDLVDQIQYFSEFYAEKSKEQLTGLALELKQRFTQITIG